MNAASRVVWLSHYLSLSGSLSRRSACAAIEAGRVRVNRRPMIKNEQIPITQQVHLDGSVVSIPAPRVFVYYKFIGDVVSHSDPAGRPSPFARVASSEPTMPRLISVGRLDKMSEGLIILTNSPDVSHFFESPSRAFHRVYRVRAGGTTNIEEIKKAIEGGCTIKGIKYRPARVAALEELGPRWFSCTVTEGKFHEVRHLFRFAGSPVRRLIRSQYGPFTLNTPCIQTNKSDTLKPGELREVAIPVDLLAEIDAFVVDRGAEQLTLET